MSILSVVQIIGEARDSGEKVANSGTTGPSNHDLVLILLVVDDEIVVVLGLDRKVGDHARVSFRETLSKGHGVAFDGRSLVDVKVLRIAPTLIG
jgi:hypothetical protein